jgi:hypothetical protein
MKNRDPEMHSVLKFFSVPQLRTWIQEWASGTYPLQVLAKLTATADSGRYNQ